MCYHIYIKQKTIGGFFTMPLITSKEMFKKAYEGKYAIGAFNVNNMEIIQHLCLTGERVEGMILKHRVYE